MAWRGGCGLAAGTAAGTIDIFVGYGGITPLASPTCPHCGSNKLRWKTERRSVHVDLLLCASCGETLVEEDWFAPLRPLNPGRCINCSESRHQERCGGCGLTSREDLQVHRELADMVGSGKSMLSAARLANRSGRRLLALKLATAAAATNEQQRGDAARALRVWLLATMGEHSVALSDAQSWVDNSPDPSAVAFAALGQQQQYHKVPGAAADSFAKSLNLDSSQHYIRARRSKLLAALNREGQSVHEACLVLEAEDADERAILLALEVAGQLCDVLEVRGETEELKRVLKRAGKHVERSARLLAHRALVAAKDGDAAAAKRDMRTAKKLVPELDLYERIKTELRPAQRGGWWRW